MARKRRRTVKARRRRTTKRGDLRRTSRRAYTGLRRRRSNPKGIFAQPSARAAMWAIGGSSAEVIVNQTPLLKNQIKNRLARSAIFAAITIFIGQTMKGRAKANSIAFGLGMLAIPIGAEVSKMNLGSAFKLNGGASKSLPAPQTESVEVVEIIRSNPGHSYGAAKAQVNRVSNGGLRAL